MAAHNRRTDDEGRSQVPLQVLEAAMEQVAVDRQEYNQRAPHGATVDDEFARKFHGDVIQYYLELRKLVTVIDEQWLWDEWQSRGLPELREWVGGRAQVQEVDNPGMGTGTERRTVPAHLPPDKLLEYSIQLDVIAGELGLRPPTEGRRQDAGFSYEDILEDGPPNDGDPPDMVTEDDANE